MLIYGLATEGSEVSQDNKGVTKPRELWFSESRRPEICGIYTKVSKNYSSTLKTAAISSSEIYWYISTTLHGVTSPNTAVLIPTATGT
jgi:hypothetical protein